MVPSSTVIRLEPLGRRWQQAWLDDVPGGGPLLFADWLAGLPAVVPAGGDATWRVDLLVANAVARSGGARVVVEPEPGGRCLAAAAIGVVESVLADLRSRDLATAEAVELLRPAVGALADTERWPVPPALRGRLETLAAGLVDPLTATGAEIRGIERLLAVPADDDAQASDALDLERAAAACLAVPRAVLASISAEAAS